MNSGRTASVLLFLLMPTMDDRHAADTATDRIELYTESYAENFPADPIKAIDPFYNSSTIGRETRTWFKAGHDLIL